MIFYPITESTFYNVRLYMKINKKISFIYLKLAVKCLQFYLLKKRSLITKT